MTREGRVATGTIAALVAYHRALRPRLLRWGATDREHAQTLPGDSRLDDPHVVSTRAVSIDAGPADVWPWLVQMGNGRGGLHSYDRLDMLFGYLPRPSADVVLPEFQDLAVGDVVPLGNGPDWPVSILEPEPAVA